MLFSEIIDKKKVLLSFPVHQPGVVTEPPLIAKRNLKCHFQGTGSRVFYYSEVGETGY